MYCLKKKGPITVFLLIAILAVPGCAGGKSKSGTSVFRTGFYFDTVVRIELAGTQGEALLNECFSLCGEMEKIFSRTREDSELYQVNHRTENQVQVSDELAEVIETGLDFGEKTDGAFDITIAPVADLWDFHSESPVIPDGETLAGALALVDYRKVHLDGNRLSFDSSEIMLDLGGIAKGYIADRIKKFLSEKGVASACINLGGNVQTIGSKPDGTPWKVGIQKPFADRGELVAEVDAVDESVVSAGVYERYFEKDGRRYCHILDPRTGYPVETGPEQVTVVSRESMIGDVLSTSCLILGEEEGRALAESLGFSNVWLHLNDRCAMIEQ